MRAVVALADQHHMRSVAEGLGVTQPAVSSATRQMQESIGVARFERTAQGMMPTPSGAALALRLKRALAEIRNAVDYAGCMPCRSFAAAVSPEARKANAARAASGCRHVVHSAPAKTVTSSMSGGSTPATTMPGTRVSSPNC